MVTAVSNPSQVNVETPTERLNNVSMPTTSRDDILRSLRTQGTEKPEIIARTPGALTPSTQDLVNIGNAVNREMGRQDIGGRGWTGNWQDSQKCGEVNWKAAEELRNQLIKAGFKDAQVGQVNSENGNMIMGNGMHSVAVVYSPGSGQAVMVDAWQNPRRVVPVNVEVLSSSQKTTEIKVNFPNGSGGYRQNGYQGTVSDVDGR